MAEGIEIGTAYVSIVPSAAGFGAALQSQLVGQSAAVGDKAGKALNTGLTSQASSLARNVTGILAGIGIGGVLKGAVAEAQEAARVGNLTASVIRSTGGAAGVSAGQVEKLATSLSRISGVDDEVIQSAENVMLTFRAVSGQVFPDAVKAALDMSAALGTDLQSSVIQLGKALNDPLQGLLALRRSGVSFTEEQQNQIKALQQSGDLLGAQQLILEEVSKEFGGAAAAGATASARFHVAIKNIEEDLGKALIPAIGGAASGLDVLLGGFEALPGPVQSATSAILAIGAAATVFALIAPKLAQVRAELDGMSIAGHSASTAIGLFGKAAGGLIIASAVTGGLNALGGALTRITAGPAAGLNALTKGLIDLGVGGRATGELAKQLGPNLEDLTNKASDFTAEGVGKLGQAFAKVLNPSLRDSLRDMDGVDKALAGLVSSGHADVAAKAVDFLAQKIREGPGGDELADKFVKHLSQYKDALAGVDAQAALTAAGIDVTGNAIEDMAQKTADAVQKFNDMHSQLDQLVADDWSKQLASNLTSALDPLKKFTVGFQGNVVDLRDQVNQAQQELDKANADLAKATPGTTAADIARIRGEAISIDDARAAVDRATHHLNDTKAQLAAAERSPLTAIQQDLQGNVTILRGWLDDITKLSSAGFKGGHEALARDLAGLGPEAANAVHEALGLTPKQLDDLQGLFAKRDKLVGDASSGLFGLNLDKAAKPGETLADILVDKYRSTLEDRLPIEFRAAVDAATAKILADLNAPHIPGGGAEPGPGEARFTPSTSGPALGPAVPPALPSAQPPLTIAPTGAPPIVLNTTVNAQTNADPFHIATQTGDAMAWRLRGSGPFPGSGW